ncbi:hypothetical protein D3C77_595580 [compost metagenome]
MEVMVDAVCRESLSSFWLHQQDYWLGILGNTTEGCIKELAIGQLTHISSMLQDAGYYKEDDK